MTTRRIESVRFATLGDRRTASSRLRAFLFADELIRVGIRAEVGAAALADIEVFQKVRDFTRLRLAASAGATIVFDFDDNYLLDEVGTKRDVLHFLLASDVVTVGSQALLELASEYHDNVMLVENPIDVDPRSEARDTRGWSGVLGWFGNRTNLGALDDLALGRDVITITRGGQIEWELETIDAELTRLDLVLIPQRATDWTMSKNANRMLKCVSLGVPVLASDTPEHRRVTAVLGLGPELLVGADESWPDRIDALADDYDRVLAQVAEVRDIARREYGVQGAVERWLDRVGAARTATGRPLPWFGEVGSRTLSRPRRQTLAPTVTDQHQLHVVCLNENGRGLVENTLRSLRIDEVNYGSVTVISAYPEPVAENLGQVEVFDAAVSDFFEIYEQLHATLSAIQDGALLYVRAGVEVARAALADLHAMAASDRIHIGDGQIVRKKFNPLPPTPETAVEILLEPFDVHYLVASANALLRLGVPAPRYLGLGWWEVLVRGLAGSETPIASGDPLFQIEERAARRTLTQSYSAWLRTRDERAANDLPDHRAEWGRLRFILYSQAIDEHRGLFAQQMGTLLPRQAAEVDRERALKDSAQAKRSHLEDKLAEAEAGYRHRKAKQAEAEEAYRQRKAKQADAEAALGRRDAELKDALGRVEHLTLELERSKQEVAAVQSQPTGSSDAPLMRGLRLRRRRDDELKEALEQVTRLSLELERLGRELAAATAEPVGSPDLVDALRRQALALARASQG